MKKVWPQIQFDCKYLQYGASINEFRKRLIESARCEIIFLTPHSPDLNPIEKF